MLTIVTAIALATALTGTAAADPPASSGVVERFDEVLAPVFVDEADGLIALGGPPLDQGCFGMGFDDVVGIMDVLLPNGVVVGSYRGEVPFQVFDATSIDELCGPVAAGETVTPLATGIARVSSNDNELENEASVRTNVFSEIAAGRLETPDGASCQFRAEFRAQIDRDGAFRVLQEDITLRC